MFLCAWLFDRARQRYVPEASPPPERVATSAPKALLRMVGGYIGAAGILLTLCKTNLLVADLLLIASLVSFSVAVYRIRLRPLLASGLTSSHLAVLIVAFALWTVPILWFIHLHLAGSYGAA
ncbi:hypothetical protein GCM10027431_27060 [Lysobacter rhizosphaerae]